MKKLQVLVSCMHHNDFKIVVQSNIKTDVLIVNQCDRDEMSDQECNGVKAKMISTTTRGLSKSRNIAIQNCDADIALICDDDERFDDDMEDNILKAFEEHEEEVLIFHIRRENKNKGEKYKRLKKLDLLKVSSVEIAFRVDKIRENGILFDENLGAGTGNGAGEENAFLLEAYKKKLKIAYVPITIGELLPSKSSWFSGFDKDYFIKRGISTRYILGLPLSVLYAHYFAFFKYGVYKKYMNPLSALYYMLVGIRINKFIGNAPNSENTGV